MAMSLGTGTDPSRFATKLFNGLPRRYDRLGYLLSMGQDRRWRSAIVDKVKARPGELVLDVATGTAGVALALRAATGAEITGIDLNANMLETARQKLAQRSEAGVRLVQGRAENLPFADDSFDDVTFTYLLRYVKDPAATVAELVRVLKPGGVLAGMDFYVPPSRFWRPLWWCYTRWVLPLGGLLTGGREWYEVGRFLGPNIEGHYARCSLATTIDHWKAAGMTDVHAEPMSLGGGLVMWGTKGSGA
jgi:demethylmenaquinone methyltransferase / 2-methoxy-6-polyprenyl-1,4-benzoquinol methylase